MTNAKYYNLQDCAIEIPHREFLKCSMLDVRLKFGPDDDELLKDGEAYNNPGKTIYDEDVNRSAVKAMKEASRAISTEYPFTCVLYYFELPETQETENSDERTN